MALSRFVRSDRAPAIRGLNAFYGGGDGAAGSALSIVATVGGTISALCLMGTWPFWWLLLSGVIFWGLISGYYFANSQSDIGDAFMERAQPLLNRIKDPARRQIANDLFDEIYDCSDSDSMHYRCDQCHDRVVMMHKLAEKPAAEQDALDKARELLKKEKEQQAIYNSIMKELGEGANTMDR